MQGVFSKLPVDTLAAALTPISERCEQLDWVVDLQSGPLKFPYYDVDEPQNLLAFHRDAPGLPMGWFARGFLPCHADCLYLDEWSSYLGFDSTLLSPEEIGSCFEASNGRQPLYPELLQLIADHKLLYILRVATGWWEAYTPDVELLGKIRFGWHGKLIKSEHWNAVGSAIYPGDRD